MEFIGNVPFLPQDWEWFLPESEQRTDAYDILRHLGSSKLTILDCPCGTGLMSAIFAKAGHRVLGVDINQRFLDIAASTASQMDVTVSLRNENMADFIDPLAFDVIINWYNSFGYFPHKMNFRILQNFCKSLSHGGVLIIEAENMTSKKNTYPRSYGSGDMYWDASTGLIHYMYDKVECVRFQYSPEQICKMLYDAGFKKCCLYGEQFSDFTKDSKLYIIEAEVA